MTAINISDDLNRSAADFPIGCRLRFTCDRWAFQKSGIGTVVRYVRAYDDGRPFLVVSHRGYEYLVEPKEVVCREDRQLELLPADDGAA